MCSALFIWRRGKWNKVWKFGLKLELENKDIEEEKYIKQQTFDEHENREGPI